MRARTLLAGLAAFAALALGAVAPAPGQAQERGGAGSDPATSTDERSALLAEIEREVMCPVCGTPLALSREAPQAQQQRRQIQALIAEGHSKEEIKEVLVAEYGPEVLAVPGTSGFDLTAWLVPGAALLLAAGAIVVGLRRWRRATAAGDGGDSAPPEPALDPEDARRLDADIRRYEL